MVMPSFRANLIFLKKLNKKCILDFSIYFLKLVFLINNNVKNRNSSIIHYFFYKNLRGIFLTFFSNL